jgi:hypothetical protein
VAVPEYWTVDLAEEAVERWRPGSERRETAKVTLLWQPNGANAPLVIDLAALFTTVSGDRR